MLETAGAALGLGTAGLGLGLFGAADAAGAGVAGAADTGLPGLSSFSAVSPVAGGGFDPAAIDSFYSATGAPGALPYTDVTGAGLSAAQGGVNPASVLDAAKDVTGTTFDASGGLTNADLSSITAQYGNDVSPIASGTSYAAPGSDVVDAVPGSAGKGGAVQPGFLDTLKQGVTNLPTTAANQVLKNPLGIGAAAVGLGLNLAQGQKQLPEQKALNAQAQQLTTQGQQFQQFLQTGTLPPGLQAAVDQAKAAAKARIIANHARSGQSTDPTQNSALAQELAQADQNALIAVAQEGEQLFAAGTNEIGLASQIYTKLLQVDQQQTQNMGRAISNFASALGSGAKAT